jgi:hypothetical protein
MKPEQRRRDLERQALQQFKEIASRYSFPVYGGQGLSNRIAQRGRSYFQFGDLRVETPVRHVVIEVESTGGVTNLVKYWYCLQEGKIVKPLTLLHVFAQASTDDYASHLLLWDTLSSKMRAELAPRFVAARYTYRSLEDLGPIVNEFDRLLRSPRPAGDHLRTEVTTRDELIAKERE